MCRTFAEFRRGERIFDLVQQSASVKAVLGQGKFYGDFCDIIGKTGPFSSGLRDRFLVEFTSLTQPYNGALIFPVTGGVHAKL